MRTQLCLLIKCVWWSVGCYKAVDVLGLCTGTIIKQQGLDFVVKSFVDAGAEPAKILDKWEAMKAGVHSQLPYFLE